MISKTPECRAAIIAGNYAAAQRLLGQLRNEVENAWPGATPEDRRSIASQVLELLSWARQTVVARRSHTQRRLLQFARHNAYSTASSSRAGLVEVDG